MLQLAQWPYIKPTAHTGSLKGDLTSFLTANNRPKTLAHCLDVTDTAITLATRFGLNQETVATAALLHDVSCVMKAQDMLAYAIDAQWPLDEAERLHPFILHQRMSAVFADSLFGVDDPATLSAISCHTTLKPSPSQSDIIVFLADKLAWDQPGTPPFAQAITAALDISLRHAALSYIDYVLENGMLLHPHQWLLAAKAWLENQP